MNGSPLTSRGLLPLKKTNSSFIERFLSNVKNNILIRLPIIIEIDIYEQGTYYHPGASPPLKVVKFFIYGAILLKFETEHFHMFTNNK